MCAVGMLSCDGDARFTHFRTAVGASASQRKGRESEKDVLRTLVAAQELMSLTIRKVRT